MTFPNTENLDYEKGRYEASEEAMSRAAKVWEKLLLRVLPANADGSYGVEGQYPDGIMRQTNDYGQTYLLMDGYRGMMGHVTQDTAACRHFLRLTCNQKWIERCASLIRRQAIEAETFSFTVEMILKTLGELT